MGVGERHARAHRPRHHPRRDDPQPVLGHAVACDLRRPQAQRPPRDPPGLRRGRTGDRSPAVARPADARRPAVREPCRGRDRDRAIAADHHGLGRHGAGAQRLWPGCSRQPGRHPHGHARARADARLRPQPLHAGLSRRGRRRRAVRVSRALRRRGRSPVPHRLGIRPVAPSAPLAGGDLPVALAARHLRLFRRDGGAGDRASRQPVELGEFGYRGPARDDDDRHRRAGVVRMGAQLGQGEARQAPVRAPLRLPHRVAALHRHAGAQRPRCGAVERADRQGLRRHPRFSRRATSGQRRRSITGARGRVELARREIARGERDEGLGRLLGFGRIERPDPRVRSASPRLGQRSGPRRRGPAVDARR